MRDKIEKLSDDLKRMIIRKAIKLGCDVDGDLMWYKGVLYYVHIRDERVVQQLMVK